MPFLNPMVVGSGGKRGSGCKIGCVWERRVVRVVVTEGWP